MDQKEGRGRFGSGLKSIRGASFRNGPIRMGVKFSKLSSKQKGYPADKYTLYIFCSVLL